MKASKQKGVSPSSENATKETSSTREAQMPQFSAAGPIGALNDSPRIVAQRQTIANTFGGTPPQGPPALTGLPTPLVNGIGRLSGINVADVRVHANSPEPARLGALAIAQGSEIHLGPGQEKHLPHEAWHIVQQRQGRVKATQQLKGVGLNDEPGLEEEATRMGQHAVEASAQNGAMAEHAAIVPITSIAGPEVVQRKVFVDKKLTLASDSAEEKEAKPEANWISVADSEKGGGARNIAAMIADGRSRYFENNKELTDYAEGETEDIGYVDREKTWIRLPDYLVLGEIHSWTTLDDVVAATGIKKYLYEGGKEKSPLLYPGAADVGGEHALEAALPKYAMGLMGLWDSLNATVDINGTQTSQLEHDRSRMNSAKAPFKATKNKLAGDAVNAAQGRNLVEAAKENALQTHAQDVANWGAQWEQDHTTASNRMLARGHIQSWKNENQALVRPYDRKNTEASLALNALTAIQSSTLPENHPLKRVYQRKRAIIDQTITQLKSGAPFTDTRLYLKILTGQFNMPDLIRKFMTAATQENTNAEIKPVTDWGADYAKDIDEPYEKTYALDPTNSMEKIRDSTMLHRILTGKKNNIRLFGLGDNHRKNLRVIIEKEDPEITVTTARIFFNDQYKEHPDKD
ncbi:MAG TPA: DUF4157 domain-containing protein [Polyangium sp.]|nr:DUF4157 domain-containing protein [Polyangium sp.]